MRKIAIVLPSRNRPEGLKRMAQSVMDLASKPDRVRVFVGLDDDDPSLDQTRAMDLPGCELVIAPAETTVAAMIDKLSWRAESWADALIRMDDDFVLETRGWDDNAECMEGLGYWRPDDPTHSRTFMSFVALSSEMAGWLRQRQGFVHPHWFPFWFTDTWNSEIGDMAGLKAPLEVRMTQPEGRGKTNGLRDIKFWAELFEGFRMHRINMAQWLIEDSYPEGVLKQSALFRLPDAAALAAHQVAHLRDEAFIAKWEQRAEAFAGTSDARYRKAKAAAEMDIAA